MITYRPPRHWTSDSPDSLQKHSSKSEESSSSPLPSKKPRTPKEEKRKYSHADLCRQCESYKKKFLSGLTAVQRQVLAWLWTFWARPDQLAPKWLWYVWFVCAGRGWGKTRTGAEWVIEKAYEIPGCVIALVGRTPEDVRNTMIEGESGIIACCEPKKRPEWKPGLKRLLFRNGSVAFIYGAENPDKLRGPQHHFAWCDELAAWRFLEETWDNLCKGLRLGKWDGVHNQICVTTTPRPLTFLRSMAADPDTHVTEGSTFDNIRNLPAKVLEKFLAIKDPRRAAQELFGKINDLAQGAKWSMSLIERCYVRSAPKTWQRVCVAVDPAEETNPDNDQTGISVVIQGWDKRGYVVETYGGKMTPEEWSDIVITRAFYWKADIVAETNRGGQMVISVIRAALYRHKHILNSGWIPQILACKSVGSKGSRSGPVSVLYGDDQARHVGAHPELENEMTTFINGFPNQDSPNRMDANNIAFSYLFELEKFKDEESGRVNMTFKPAGL